MNGPRFTLTRSFSLVNSQISISKFSFSLKFYSYEVEFTKPHSIKPIPEGTVKVFFSLIEKANGDCIVEFNFENESLKHKLDNTMRTNMFEVSIIMLILHFINELLFLALDR